MPSKNHLNKENKTNYNENKDKENNDFGCFLFFLLLLKLIEKVGERERTTQSFSRFFKMDVCLLVMFQ